MPLELQVDSLDNIDEAQKSLYVEKDGKFVLDVNLPENKPPADYDDLRESVKKLEANNQALLKEKAEAKKAADKSAHEAAKTSGDIEAVEKSWQEKYNALAEERDNSSKSYQSMINNLTVGAAATRMAADLATDGSAPVLEPHIKSRLSVEIKDGTPKIRVLDASGQPSAKTLEELAEEFKSMKAFAPIIKGSLASGGGPAGDGGSDAAPRITLDKFNSMSPMEKAEFAKKKGEIV